MSSASMPDPLTHHSNVVRQEARKIAGAWAKTRRFSIHDLAQEGALAAHKLRLRKESTFDASRGVTFDEFSRSKIRWAMLDALRTEGFGSRTNRCSESFTILRHAVQKAVRDPRWEHIADYAPSPEKAAIAAETQRVFWSQVRTNLSAREYEIVERYFVFDDDLKTIGARFGITESRVCQVIAQIKKRLRPVLAAANGF